MPRKQYQERLDDLRAEVSAMADLALDRYDEAVGVLETGDAAETRRIIDGDTQLNEWYLDIERECIELLTARQMDPDEVESTLEDVSRALLTIRDLERVGDHAVNVSARTLYMVEHDDELIY